MQDIDLNQLEQLASHKAWGLLLEKTQQYLKKNHDSAKGWFLLGLSRFETGVISESIKCCNKSLEIKYNHESLFLLGRSYEITNEPILADQFYGKACLADKKNKKYPLYRVVNLLNNKLYEEVKKIVPEIILHSTESGIYPLALMSAYEETGDRNVPEEILDLCAGYVESSGDYGTIIKYLNFITFEGRKEDLEAFLLDEKKNKGNQQIILYAKAKIAELELDNEAVEINLRKTLELEWNLDVCFALCNFLYEIHKLDQAIDIMTEYSKKIRDPALLGYLASFYTYKANGAEKAIQLFKKSIEANEKGKEIKIAKWNYAIALLQSGNLKQGWQYYKYREDFFLKRKFLAKKWQGEPLENQIIMIWSEQGVGDHVLFSSLLNDFLKEFPKTKKIIFETEPRLLKIVQRSFPEIYVRANPRIKSDNTPYLTDYTYHVPIADLFSRYRNDLRDFPIVPHLKCDPYWEQEWKRRIPKQTDKKYVGFAWKTGIKERSRDIYFPSIANLGNLLINQEDVFWVNLQYGDCDRELEIISEKYGIKLHTWEDINLKDDFDAVAALMKHLDLVITGPTAVMQLAGSVGANLWPLITNPNWFLLGQNYLPWFPKARVYRTNYPTPIDHALVQINKDLQRWKKGEILPATVVMCEETPELLSDIQLESRYLSLEKSELALAKHTHNLIEMQELTASPKMVRHLKNLETHKVQIIEKDYPSNPIHRIDSNNFLIEDTLINRDVEITENKESNTLLIWFQEELDIALPFSEVSPYLVPAFTLSSHIKEFVSEQASIIVVRDRWQMGYQVGPAGSALLNPEQSFEHWVQLLQQKITQIAPQKIICGGKSTGGSAAILFSQALKASTVIALSPYGRLLDDAWEIEQTKCSFIDVQEGWRRKIRNRFMIPPLDLKHSATALGANLSIIIPKLCIQDKKHANYLAEKSAINLVCSTGKDHGDINLKLLNEIITNALK